MPAGYRADVYRNEGDNAVFWSSTENDGYNAYFVDLRYSGDNAFLYNDYKYYGFSVRCLKN